MQDHAEDFIRLLRNPVKFRLFLFLRLPSAFFAGVRVKEINQTKCAVSVPYKWFSQNPFRSTYFACLAMAAEMSTGALCLAHIHKRQPAISMLVVKVESDYYKKATGLTVFSCNSGNEIRLVIEEAVQTGESRSLRVQSSGKNNLGETVADFWITWSFKVKRVNVSV